GELELGIKDELVAKQIAHIEHVASEIRLYVPPSYRDASVCILYHSWGKFLAEVEASGFRSLWQQELGKWDPRWREAVLNGRWACFTLFFRFISHIPLQRGILTEVLPAPNRVPRRETLPSSR